MEGFALCDIVLAQIKVEGGTTHSFSTSDEISCEPVIQEGEEKSLAIKGRMIANKKNPDLILGHDFTCKDNVFSPDLLADLQGGKVTKDSGQKFKKYTAPVIGALPKTKQFEFIAFVEVVDDAGPTGEYLKYTYPNCRGSFISTNLKDGEYYASQYKFSSRPSLGVGAYEVELVIELPAGTVKFEHPSLQLKED